jgi:hypothetical protein
MPTIVLIKDGKTDHSIHGFDEFGGTDDFSNKDMAYILATHGLLNYENDRSEEISSRTKKAGFNTIKVSKIESGNYDNFSDEED